MPTLFAGLAMALGLGCAAQGARTGIFRVVSPLISAFVGVIVAPDVLKLVAGVPQVTPALVTLATPLILAGVASFAPLALAFVCFGTFGAILGAGFMPDHQEFVGAAPGFLVVGIVGVLFGRYVATVLSAIFGAYWTVGGALALLGHSSFGSLLNSGVVPLIAVAILAVLGTSFQLVTYKSDEQRAQLADDARQKKQMAKENKEREERFAGYRRKDAGNR